MTTTPGGTYLANNSQNDIFWSHTETYRTVDADSHIFHLLGDQALSCQDMLNLRSTYTMCQTG